MSNKLEISMLGSGDQSAIEALFKESFGYAVSKTLWKWKYADSRGRNLIIKKDGKIVAHYGGMQRAISYFGEKQKAIQIGDVMVAKNERGVLKKQGLYFQITAAFLERYIGFETEHLLGFGFPTPTALKLACKLGLYANVDEIVELHYSSIKARPSFKYHLIELENSNSEAYFKAFNRLWRRMREEYQNDILVERDWDYLNYRYFQHPVNDYKSFIMKSRLTQQVIGLLIFKFQQEQERWMLMDFLVTKKHIDALFFQAARIVERLGQTSFTVWVTGSHIARLPATWHTKETANISIPSNIWHQGPDSSEIIDKWWLTAGDTDFL